MNTEGLVPGVLVMYRPERAVAGSPHIVLERTLDTAVIKPLFMVLSERFGSVVVPVTQLKPSRLVKVVSKPQLVLTERQLELTLRALEYYAQAGDDGKVNLAGEEFCTLYNAKNALEDFKQKKGIQ